MGGGTFLSFSLSVTQSLTHKYSHPLTNSPTPATTWLSSATLRYNLSFLPVFLFISYSLKNLVIHSKNQSLHQKLSHSIKNSVTHSKNQLLTQKLSHSLKNSVTHSLTNTATHLKTQPFTNKLTH